MPATIQPADRRPPLRLHWWAGNPNFGDALSVTLVRYMSGRDVEHTSPARAEIFALGSLLRTVRKNYLDVPADGNRPVLWGCGMLNPIRKEFLPNVDVALVRGPVTAAFLGLHDTRLGDPGLLVSLMWPKDKELGHIGVVPHHQQLENGDADRILAQDPALKLIDVRRDPKVVCREISQCAHVYASSLHGLVAADSYGVPSTWIDPGDQGWLKYLDYAAGIGRDMPRPMPIDEIGAHMRGLRDGPLPHAEGIERSRREILDSFPEALKARRVS